MKILARFREFAFVLRRWDVGESDQVLTLLTKSRGRIRAVAKGSKRSRRRFGGLLAPFLLLEVECFETQQREWVRVDSCSLLRSYPRISEDLERLVLGCCLLEVVERVVPEGQEEQSFFDLLTQGFDWLQGQRETGPVLAAFLLKTLTGIGVQPQFALCVRCRRRLQPWGQFGFSMPQGGVVCGNCVRSVPVTRRVSADTLSMLQAWLPRPLDGASYEKDPPVSVREAEDLLAAFLAYHTGKELRSLRVLRRVRSDRYLSEAPASGYGGVRRERMGDPRCTCKTSCSR